MVKIKFWLVSFLCKIIHRIWHPSTIEILYNGEVWVYFHAHEMGALNGDR